MQNFHPVSIIFCGSSKGKKTQQQDAGRGLHRVIAAQILNHELN